MASDAAENGAAYSVEHAEAKGPTDLDWMSASTKLAQFTTLDAETDLLTSILSLTEALCVAIWVPEQDRTQFLWAEADAGYRDSLSESLRDCLLAAQKNQRGALAEVTSPRAMVCFASPLSAERGDLPVAGVLLPAGNQERMHQSIKVFQSLLGYLLAFGQNKFEQETLEAYDHTAAWLEISTNLLQESRFKRGALRLCEQIQQHLGCTVATLGRVTRNDRVKLTALNGVAHFDPHGKLAELVTAAMQAGARHGSAFFWPGMQESSKTGSDSPAPALQEICHQQKSGRAAVLPIEHDSFKAVLLLVWEDDAALPATTARFLEAALPPMGVLLAKLWQTEPRGLRRYLRHNWVEASTLRRSLWLGGFLALAGVLSLPTYPPCSTGGLPTRARKTPGCTRALRWRTGGSTCAPGGSGRSRPDPRAPERRRIDPAGSGFTCPVGAA